MQHGRIPRADIEGLRGAAVIAVLAFDASARWLPGGFAGVDILFALSGYMITSTVAQDIAGGTFDLRAFYERRLRRLLPGPQSPGRKRACRLGSHGHSRSPQLLTTLPRDRRGSRSSRQRRISRLQRPRRKLTT